MSVIWKKTQLFSTVILGSVFSDSVVRRLLRRYYYIGLTPHHRVAHENVHDEQYCKQRKKESHAVSYRHVEITISQWANGRSVVLTRSSNIRFAISAPSHV